MRFGMTPKQQFRELRKVLKAKAKYRHIICQHHRRQSECVVCAGKAICEHGHRRRDCVACCGRSICKHNRRRRQCVFCRGEAALISNRRYQYRRMMEKDYRQPLTRRTRGIDLFNRSIGFELVKPKTGAVILTKEPMRAAD